MASYNNAYTFKLFKLLRRAGIRFAVCPAENLYLQGRQDSYPKRRGITRVKELLEAGLNVSFAQDSISDPWYPLGNGNLMNILDIGLHACQLMSLKEIENALDLITVHGAKTMNLDAYGIKEGRMADFIILDAGTPFDAVQSRQMYCVRSDTENCYLKRRNLSVRQDMSCWYSKLNDLEETDRAGGMHSPALGLITALRKFVI